MIRLLMAWTALTLACTKAEDTPSLLPEKLDSFRGTVGELIPYKDGVLVVTDGMSGCQIGFTNFESGHLTKHKIDGFDTVSLATRVADGIAFLGVKEDQWVITRETAAGIFTPIPTPSKSKTDTRGLRLLPSTHGLAATTGSTLWWFDGEWRHLKIPVSDKLRNSYFGAAVGGAAFLEKNILYSGWDRGEFGGVFASLDISSTNPTWKIIGKPSAKDGHPPNWISGLMPGPNGSLWTFHGLDHMNISIAELHHRNAEGKWETLINDQFEEGHRGPLPLPEESSITGMALDSKGRPICLISTIGIVRLEGDKLEAVVKQNFMSYSVTRKSERLGLLEVCLYPTAFAMSRQGDFFVGTNSFGVLAFHQTDGKWVAKQIAIGEPEPSLDK